MEVNNFNVVSHLFLFLVVIVGTQCEPEPALRFTGEIADSGAPVDVDFSSTNVHSRAVRDVAGSLGTTSPKLVPSYKYCCGGANNTAYTTRRSLEIVSRFRICGKEAKEKRESQDEWTQHGNPMKDPFSPARIKKLKSDTHCLANCMMRKREAMNSDGTINTEEVKDNYRNELTSDWIIKLAENAVDKCATEKGNTWIKQDPGMECTPRAANFYHCVWKEIIMTCPDERYIKNDYCKRVKEAFEEEEE